MKIDVTQKNWDGKGSDRTFTSFVCDNELFAKLDQIFAAYNPLSTEVRVAVEQADPPLVAVYSIDRFRDWHLISRSDIA